MNFWRGQSSISDTFYHPFVHFNLQSNYVAKCIQYSISRYISKVALFLHLNVQTAIEVAKEAIV